jgi:hypothetical protein
VTGGSSRLAFLVLVAVGCATVQDEELPMVRPVSSLFDAPEACVAPPPPAPFQEALEGASDPEDCLSRAWRDRALPLVMTIVDGRVRAFRFYDQCQGKVVQVDSSVRECIATSLRTWRFRFDGPCPGHQAVWTEYRYLRPPSAEAARVASSAVKGGCGG